MAALAITAANVLPSAAAVRVGNYNAGVAITAGQAIYLDSNNLWQLASNAAVASQPTAIAANNAAVGQRVDAILSDPALTHGLTGVAAGDTIWGLTAGNQTKTLADLTAGTFTTMMGVALSATQMKLSPVAVQTAHA